jgi:hypothetical protein
VKEAFSVIGPFIVIEAGLFVPEKELVPPASPIGEAVAAGHVAAIETVVPLPLHPLGGVTVPPL